MAIMRINFSYYLKKRGQIILEVIMFDQQEQKLLASALSRVRKDYQNNKNVYSVSAFDMAFDNQLNNLVLYYCFDFEMIALHLDYKYPHYGHRLKPQAVSYRWYQLILQRQGESTSINIQEKRLSQSQNQSSFRMENELKSQTTSLNQSEKKIQYQVALQMASVLDEEEEEGFMLYKPKFIVDSEFKLERQTVDSLELNVLLGNELNFQFGSFESPQAAPLNLNFLQFNSSAAPAPMCLSIEEEELYLDQDWQAYQSD